MCRSGTGHNDREIAQPAPPGCPDRRSNRRANITLGFPDCRGLLAAWRRPEGAFVLVRPLLGQCPAYRSTRHQQLSTYGKWSDLRKRRSAVICSAWNRCLSQLPAACLRPGSVLSAHTCWSTWLAALFAGICPKGESSLTGYPPAPFASCLDTKPTTCSLRQRGCTLGRECQGREPDVQVRVDSRRRARRRIPRTSSWHVRDPVSPVRGWRPRGAICGRPCPVREYLACAHRRRRDAACVGERGDRSTQPGLERGHGRRPTGKTGKLESLPAPEPSRRVERTQRRRTSLGSTVDPSG